MYYYQVIDKNIKNRFSCLRLFVVVYKFLIHVCISYNTHLRDLAGIHARDTSPDPDNGVLSVVQVLS